MTHESPPRAWVEVDLEAIAHNLKMARQIAGEAQLMPVVKANAYGHGMEAVARRLDSEGIAAFGVANVGEARRLELAGLMTRPFILGPTLPEEREEIVRHGWGCTVSSVAEVEHFQRLGELCGRQVTVHMAVDTGMGREGFLPSELSEVAQLILSKDHVKVEGLMSHFPAADEDEGFTRAQAQEFASCAEQLRSSGVPLRYCHISASAGELVGAAKGMNMVRPGLMLYGVAPVPASVELRPALRLYSRVVLVRELPAGHGVSYGRTWVTPGSTRVATVGIGYADGWQRSLSGQGVWVYIRGQFCPMLGRVTMDQIMVDVTAAPTAAAGDEVELIGPHLSVQQVAERAGTIPWEIFTGLGTRLPRVYRSALS